LQWKAIILYLQDSCIRLHLTAVALRSIARMGLAGRACAVRP
jgi:hypothetical protein